MLRLRKLDDGRGALSLSAAEEGVRKTIGVILIALGVFGLAWGGFTYTTREKVVDIGPIHATRDEKHMVPLPPFAGAVALIGGIVLLVVGTAKPAALRRFMRKHDPRCMVRI